MTCRSCQERDPHTYHLIHHHARRIFTPVGFQTVGSPNTGYGEQGYQCDSRPQQTSDSDTLAGLLLELKGEFPALHEKVTYDHYEFEVLEMDNRRILKVKFTINTLPSDSDKKD